MVARIRASNRHENGFRLLFWTRMGLSSLPRQTRGTLETAPGEPKIDGSPLIFPWNLARLQECQAIAQELNCPEDLQCSSDSDADSEHCR
jgi:hypothetical protein